MELVEVTSFTTPQKRRQGQLSDFWRTWSNGSSPATPKTSHTTLRRMLTPEATARFDSELEDQRLMAESAEKERRAQAKFRREHSSGMLLDPDDLGRGVKRGWGVGGRPQGKDRVYDGTHKPRALPSLRRDVPAQCKLQIIMDWWKTAKKHDVDCIKKLSREVKQELFQKWHWPLSRILEWQKIKKQLEQVVATLRLGKNGLRACGRRPGRCLDHRVSQGARLSTVKPGEVTAKRPLEGVMSRLEKWFKLERQYGHEVRRKTIIQRLKVELEYERDLHQVYKETGNEKYNPKTLERAIARLNTFRVSEMVCKDSRWFDEHVLQRIKAHGRAGQRCHENKGRLLNDNKAKLTWATADRCIHLIARSKLPHVQEELHKYVRDPAEFGENSENTSVVAVDATALWVKLRGEEKVYLHEDELDARRTKQMVERLRKKAQKTQSDGDKKEFEAELDKFMTDQKKEQVDQIYSKSGDKYRITLVNISAVKDWFKPSVSPQSDKRKSILLVPCTKHCRISDMDLTTDTWLRDVTYERSDGTMEHFEKGKPIGALLKGWRKGLQDLGEEECKMTLDSIEIWGQPRAWTDELIASWVVDFIKDEGEKSHHRPRSRRQPAEIIGKP